MKCNSIDVDAVNLLEALKKKVEAHIPQSRGHLYNRKGSEVGLTPNAVDQVSPPPGISMLTISRLPW